MKVFIVLMFILATQTLKAQTIKVLTFKIPRYILSEKSGYFIEFSKEVARRLDRDIKFTVAPHRQSISLYNKGRGDCLFPVVPEMMKGQFNHTKPLFIKRDYAFSYGETPLGHLDKLKGKVVGLTKNHPYKKNLIHNSGFHSDYAPSNLSNFRKLIAGRIDYFILEEKTALEEIHLNNLKGIKYDPQNPLTEQKVFYSCRDQQLNEDISNVVEDMKRDGTYDRIFDHP